MWQIAEVTVCIILLITMFLFRNYEKEALGELFPAKKKLSFAEKMPKKFCYPLVYFILKRTGIIFRFMAKSRNVEKLVRLDINFSKEAAASRFLIKAGGNVVLLLIAVLILAAGVDFMGTTEQKLYTGDYILRPKSGQDSVRLLVKMKEGENEKTEEIRVKLKEEKLTYEEYEGEINKAKEYIDKNILGENISQDYVDKPLNLVSKIPGSRLKLAWKVRTNSCIKEDGNLTDKLTKEKTLESVTAVLSYGDWLTEYEQYFLLYPPKKTWEEWAREELGAALLEEDNLSSSQAIFTLPKSAGGVSFSYTEPEEKMTKKVLIGGLIVIVFIIPIMMKNVVKRMEKREFEMLLDYPEFINKLTLLLGAGLTIPKAWKRIVEEYEKKGKCRYTYEEAALTLRDMENGISISEAIEDFGKRIQLIPYMKVSSLIVQNMKKGTENLLILLEYEAIEAFKERKETAKRLGEQAGTKLLFPMIIMMGIVFGIILLPAVSGF